MKRILASLLAFSLMLSACGGGGTSATQSSSPAVEEGSYPLTVTNHTRPEGGETWRDYDITFEAAPQRIVAATRTDAELLLHLGLGDYIVGVGGVFGEGDEAVQEEFAALNQLSASYISKEVALSVDPDLVFGRGGLFDNATWGVGTVDSLQAMGVNTYVMNSSVTGATFDVVYSDIENLGKIFGVEEAAAAFAAELHAEQDALISALAAVEESKTFAYFHTSDPENLYIYGAGSESFFNYAFKMIHMENIFESENGTISLEMLIEQDPDVLILLQWNEEDPQATQKVIDAIKSNPQLATLQAVQNDAIYALDYNYLFSYGYQSLKGMEELARKVYPECFAN